MIKKMRFTYENNLFRKGIILLLFTFVCSGFINGQETTVSGTVVDGVGNVLPGATISLKGTDRGVITDIDGNFEISVPGNDAVLSITFIGYLPEELKVGDQTQFSIILIEDITELSEVVVVGYGTQKKSDLTGSIASVSGEDLQLVPVSSVDQALQGMAAGVNIIPVTGRPGSPANIQIRGIASINGTDPLIILDGVSQGTEPSVLSSINPDEIQSIEVLKDASSAAIYGASGGNGVILITTKGGKSGEMKVKYNGFYGIENTINQLEMMNSEEWIELQDETSTSASPFTTRPDTFSTYNWQDIFFQPAVSQKHDLSISGGNEKSTFLLSVGYSDEEGIIKNTSHQRFNMRINSSHKINKFLTLEERVSYVNNTTNGFADWEYSGYYQNPVAPALQMIPYQEAYDENGDWTIPYGGITNPMVAIDMKDNTMRSNEFKGNFSAIIAPVKGLSYTFRFSPSMGFGDNKEFLGDYWAAPTNNRTQNSLVQRMDRSQSWNIQNVITYNSTLFDDHNITLMAGQEAGRWWGYDINGQRVDMPSELPELLYLSMSVNDTLAVQVIEGGGYEGRSYRYFGRINYNYKEKYLLAINVSRDYASNHGPNNKAGTFPSFSVGWKFTEENFMSNYSFINFGKLRVSWGQTGANATSGFPYLTTVVTPDGYMYAVNGRVANIGAGPDKIANPSIRWESINMLNYGLDINMFNNKITLSAEYFVKVNDGMIMPQQIPYMTGAYNMTMPEVNIGSIENKGFDFTLGHKNAVGGLNYSLNLNVGIVRNKVLSLATDSLRYGALHNVSPITLTREGYAISEFWGFQTDGLFADSDPTTIISNRTVITNQPYSLDEDGNPRYMQLNAKPGDYRFVDQNGDGVLNDGDKIPLGSPLPKFTFGFSVNMQYKMFDLVAFFTGSVGNKVFNGTKQYLYYSNGYGNRLAAFADRYKEEVVKEGIVVVHENKDTDIARFSADNYARSSDFYIEDGSYLRMRTLQLGVTLPASVSNRVGISKFRVYAGGKNLFTLTKYSAYDPLVSGGRTDTAEGTLTQGIDLGAYPSTKMFMLGVNLEF
jgi:TonB-linked SusC/RagA family outer membrane protein